MQKVDNNSLETNTSWKIFQLGAPLLSFRDTDSPLNYFAGLIYFTHTHTYTHNNANVLFFHFPARCQ